jgi:hypothetical protein
MKKLRKTVALFLLLASLAVSTGYAQKPAYCVIAVNGCITDCGRYFSWFPTFETGCVVGCEIGYARCG